MEERERGEKRTGGREEQEQRIEREREREGGRKGERERETLSLRSRGSLIDVMKATTIRL